MDQNARTNWDVCPLVLLYREALEIHLKSLVGEGCNFLKKRTDPISLSGTVIEQTLPKYEVVPYSGTGALEANRTQTLRYSLSSLIGRDSFHYAFSLLFCRCEPVPPDRKHLKHLAEVKDHLVEDTQFARHPFWLQVEA